MTSSGARAQDEPKETPKEARPADPSKADVRTAEELKLLKTVLRGQPVTVFSKDHGPLEGMTIVGTVEFRGMGFFHLQTKNGKTMLLRCENVTLIRED